MPITALPAPPNKLSDTVSEFTAKADAFLGALPDFGDEANALAADVNTKHGEATTAASTATTKAAEASASANAAIAAPGTNATSTTSVSIGLGSKSFTIQTGKSYVVGMTMKIAVTASPTTWMVGDITAYNSGTGALTVNVTYVSGVAGTYAAWTMSVSGPVSQAFGVDWKVKTADVVMTETDNHLGVMVSTGCDQITLPTTPSVGFTFGVHDLKGTFHTTNVTITRNGHLIMGLAEDMILNVRYQTVIFVYSGATDGWRVVYAVPVGGVTVPFQVLHIRHQEAQGTAAGASAATTHVRKLNTEMKNEVPGASLDTVNNRVTLPAGTYEVDISCPTYGAVGLNKVRLYNYSDTAYLAEGINNAGVASMAGLARLKGTITLAATKVLEVRHYIAAAVATNGLGAAVSQGVEVYTEAIFRRRTS